MMEQQYSLSARIAMRLRSLYAKTIGPKEEKYYTDYSIKGRDRVNEIIYNGLMEDKPFMAARLGRTEMQVMENLKYSVFGHHRSNLKYIQWKGQPNFINWWQMEQFKLLSGFFPWNDLEMLKRYYQLTLQDMRQVDVLGSWLYNEADFKDELGASIKVDRELMTPLLTEKTWMRALEGKKVLVIHPFKQTIERQYAQREKIFPAQSGILPEFQLTVIKAVQTVGGEKSEFSDWFAALDYMKRQMDAVDYDICLLGCGAYGFPLAAYAKQCGKKAVHIGGVLQLLFGIKGRRWETDPGYIKLHPYAQTYYNEFWVRPDETEKPQKADGIEGGCYW